MKQIDYTFIDKETDDLIIIYKDKSVDHCEPVMVGSKYYNLEITREDIDSLIPKKERVIKVGDNIRARVHRPYNGHDITVHGNVIELRDTSFIVKLKLGGIMEFLITDIEKSIWIFSPD